MSVAIRLDRVEKQFENITALNGVSAEVIAGQVVGLVGPDGAGKTTLMRILAGLMTPSQGRAEVAGYDVAIAAADIHFVTGYMPQQFGLYEDLSVSENLDLYANLRDLSDQKRASMFASLLEFTGLQPFTGRLAGKLSGGMKQKLGLACALLSQPQILLLDEPSVGVDPVSRRELWRMVRELAGDGMTVVWSTAYLDEAERCDQVILLDEGDVCYSGPPAKLTTNLEGRCRLVTDIHGDRRLFLTEALRRVEVRDGVIQGASVRLVLDQHTDDAQLFDLFSKYNAAPAIAQPRFEDAFIDMLGGGSDGASVLAERMDAVAIDRDVMARCEGLTKRFGDFTAADHVSFEVVKGEIFGLLGPNGAGKSTTFKMLCGLLKPDEGFAEVAGESLRSSARVARAQLGYMAQKFSLYGLLTVEQNLEFFSGVYGLRRSRRRRRIEEMIETFELQRFLSTSPDQLPLGYKQRLALACALMHRPPVLFLDEPTSGVDPLTRREFWTHISGLVNKGMTVLVTTHFMDEAEYCDRVALVNNGQVIALDSPDQLKASVASAEQANPTMEDAFVGLIERSNQALMQEAVA